MKLEFGNPEHIRLARGEKPKADYTARAAYEYAITNGTVGRFAVTETSGTGSWCCKKCARNSNPRREG